MGWSYDEGHMRGGRGNGDYRPESYMKKVTFRGEVKGVRGNSDKSHSFI